MKKEIVQENGTITIEGNNQWREIKYDIPEWNKDKENADYEACFDFKGNRYFLSEILRTNHEGVFKEYDGYMSDSYFSGLVVNLNKECDAVQVCRYRS
jgi:hypothetical protein